MILNFARNPYFTGNSLGVQRSFQLRTGPLSVQGSNHRSLDEKGYHHDNQVAVQTLGTEWATLLGASTETTYQSQPAPGLTWTRQWMA